ncbi:MAG: cytochrome c3 family protein [Spirochaetota bacterium]
MKGTRTFLLFFLPFVIFAYISLIVFQQACDYAMNVQAKKLLPFNHRTHTTKYGATDCETCHSYDSNGRFNGIPTVAVCKQCHDPNKVSTQVFFAGFGDNDKPWESFAQQPDLVYFSHIAVMKNEKKAQCISCHGDKGNSTTPAKIKGKMAMGTCMDCHTALKISNACTVCHD